MKIKISLLMFLSILLTGCSFLTKETGVNSEVTEEEWRTALNFESYANSTIFLRTEDATAKTLAATIPIATKYIDAPNKYSTTLGIVTNCSTGTFLGSGGSSEGA